MAYNGIPYCGGFICISDDDSLINQRNSRKRIYTLVPSAVGMMLYGVIFSVMSEAGIPRALTGTAIGIASIIGYAPDSLYSLIFGGMLDKWGGGGYNYIFIFLIASCIVGAVFTYLVRKLGLKSQKEQKA